LSPLPADPGDLKGRVAIVTGASRGIGAATAQRLAADGAAVVLAARSEVDLRELARRIEVNGGIAIPVTTDAGDIAALDALVATTVDRFGRIDVVVNNAGVLPKATRAEKMPVEEWQRTFSVNVTAPWHLACRAKEVMANSGGVVINISSTAALYPTVGFSAYNASKAALSMLTRTLALEWARDNIRVLGIAPGKVATDMVQDILAYSNRNGRAVNPLGRVGAPEEVAELIRFVAGDQASFMTGTIITFDGGEVLLSGSDLAR
jgi:3-oxoacyl-[acyl-carrier protein] reductase